MKSRDQVAAIIEGEVNGVMYAVFGSKEFHKEIPHDVHEEIAMEVLATVEDQHISEPDILMGIQLTLTDDFDRDLTIYVVVHAGAMEGNVMIYLNEHSQRRFIEYITQKFDGETIFESDPNDNGFIH